MNGRAPEGNIQIDESLTSFGNNIAAKFEAPRGWRVVHLRRAIGNVRDEGLPEDAEAAYPWIISTLLSFNCVLE